MGVINKLSDNIRRGLLNWLQVQPGVRSVQIYEDDDFQSHAVINRLWYWGEGTKLEQIYRQRENYTDRYKFWASKCTPGMEMRKIHTGLPGLIVRIMSGIVLADMNEFEFESPKQEALWAEIEKKNEFRKLLEKCLKEVLYIGDGAFKIIINTKTSEYPILKWYPGDHIEIVREYGRLKEVVFKESYTYNGQQYILYEHYGRGYIRNKLYRGDTQVDVNAISATQGLKDCKFANAPDAILAVHLNVYESAKWDGRGGSIYDGKLDSFDALDEIWSQWMDALRKGRAIKYIPENIIPRDPHNGELLKTNPFDNAFMKIKRGFSEEGEAGIEVVQPAIPHDSYLASYVTALDLCLQGIISPSTLGIDVKKLDNAEAQREKEKATLYTRNAIVEALQEGLPDVVTVCINAYHILLNEPVEEVKVNIPFGEYANPSFESQVETVGKARTQGIMSVERAVEELYGDSLDEHCKQEEIARLKAEQGIASVENPGVNQSVVSFGMNMGGGNADAGQSSRPGIPDGPGGIQGIAESGK